MFWICPNCFWSALKDFNNLQTTDKDIIMTLSQWEIPDSLYLVKKVLNFKEFNPRFFFVHYPDYMYNSNSKIKEGDGFDTDVTIQLYFRMFMTIYSYLYHIHHEVWCENVKDLLSITRHSIKL